MSKTKRPTSKNDPTTNKIPRHVEPFIDKKKVFWSFSIYDSGIKFPSTSQNDIIFSQAANCIKDCELRTWPDIEKNRKRDHPISVDVIEPFARARLAEIGQDDIDELWSIHFNGLFRLWAIREQSLLKILWLDPEHQICPSRIKRT